MVVHGIRTPYDPFEAIAREVLSPSERMDDLREEAEILVLHEQSVTLEERDDDVSHLRSPLNAVRQHGGSGALGSDPADTEVQPDRVEYFPVSLMLVQVEVGLICQPKLRWA